MYDEKHVLVGNAKKAVKQYKETKSFPYLYLKDKYSRLRLSNKPKFNDMEKDEDYIIFEMDERGFNDVEIEIEAIVPAEDSHSYYAYVTLTGYRDYESESFYGYITLSSNALKSL